MVTKSDYGLGPLYHGTSKDSADAILEGGLLVMGGQPIWLSYSKEEALENAREKEGTPAILEVNLPEDWLLDRAEAGTYISWRDIPSEHIKAGILPDNIELSVTQGTLSTQLEQSVQQQIAWKSTPDAGNIWGMPYESTWARDEWGKIINGHVTLFHGTNPYLLPVILRDGIKLSEWIPAKELEEGEEVQKGVWLTTTPYYAFFYGDVAVRVRVPASWIDKVMGDEIWLDRDVPADMIVEHKSIDEWRGLFEKPVE